jgi:hypothetical protein
MEEEGARAAGVYAARAGAAWLSALVRQLEYYLGDESLPADQFLYHETMHGSSRAWVTIRTLLTFPRLRKLGVRAEEVRRAVAESTLLEGSPDGRAVRRTRPLPGEGGEALAAGAAAAAAAAERASRTVRVENLHALLPAFSRGDPSEEQVRAHFVAKIGAAALPAGSAGPVLSVAIVKPDPSAAAPAARGGGRPAPPRFAHALVELASSALAQLAVDLHKGGDWRRGLDVKREKPAGADKGDKQQRQQKEEPKEQQNQQQKEPAQMKQELGAATPPASSGEAAAGDAEAGHGAEAAEEAEASKKKVYSGKVRTLDSLNLEVFIAPNAEPAHRGKQQQQRGGKHHQHSAARTRSVSFSCKDNGELFAKLRVGMPVSYTLGASEQGGGLVAENLTILPGESDEERCARQEREKAERKAKEDKDQAEYQEMLARRRAQQASKAAAVAAAPAAAPASGAAGAAAAAAAAATAKQQNSSGTYAIGPPNSSSAYRGFGDKEWRGCQHLRRKAC